MNYKLNLNQPSGTIIKVILVFLVLIPAVLIFTQFALRVFGVELDTLFALSAGSVAIAIAISIVFSILIVIELIQDHFVDVLYRKHKNLKLPIANGYYECQHCGNRLVRVRDDFCLVCGNPLV